MPPSLGEFPWVMLACNLLFCDDLRASVLTQGRPRGESPSPLRAARHERKASAGVGRGAAAAEPGASDHSRATRCDRWAFAVGSVHVMLQVLLPLRPLLVHRLDPLDACHVKTHTLLSWRMMAVSTRNFINVSLRSDVMGASVHMTRTYNRLYVLRRNRSRELLRLTPLLEPRQAGYMPYSPHMLVAFARHVAVTHGCEARHGCRVVGDLWSAINGRPLQRFVDPHVDLAAAVIEDHRRPAWVLPLLAQYGNSTWRARMAALRRRLATAGHAHAAFFADVAGGVFYEAFPSVHPFPVPYEARALLSRDAHRSPTLVRGGGAIPLSAACHACNL